MAVTALRGSSASAVVSRDAVGSEATSPNTPSATATAKSNTILPGSCTARGFRRGDNTLDKAVISPPDSAVLSSTAAPACATPPEPDPPTTSCGYGDLHFAHLNGAPQLRAIRPS